MNSWFDITCVQCTVGDLDPPAAEYALLGWLAYLCDPDTVDVHSDLATK